MTKRRHPSRVFAISCAISALAVATLLSAAPPATVEAMGADGQPCDVNVPEGRHINDYRTRANSSQATWDAADVKRNHYDPATSAMRQGYYSRSVKADLSFVMSSWPNYYPVLEALITYDLSGGQQYDFPTTLCYLERAKAAFPDDAKVLLLEGYYFWKKKEQERAISAYEDALNLDPDARDAHYSLGLIYLDMGQFDKAREHAKAAYDAGYPLGGLRNKLAKAGYPLAAASP